MMSCVRNLFSKSDAIMNKCCETKSKYARDKKIPKKTDQNNLNINLENSDPLWLSYLFGG